MVKKLTLTLDDKIIEAAKSSHFLFKPEYTLLLI